MYISTISLRVQGKTLTSNMLKFRQNLLLSCAQRHAEFMYSMIRASAIVRAPTLTSMLSALCQQKSVFVNVLIDFLELFF